MSRVPSYPDIESREEVERRERSVRRFVGGTFLALALYVSLQAGWALWSRDVPEESTVGIVLASLALSQRRLRTWMLPGVFAVWLVIGVATLMVGALFAAQAITTRGMRARAGPQPDTG